MTRNDKIGALTMGRRSVLGGFLGLGAISLLTACGGAQNSTSAATSSTGQAGGRFRIGYVGGSGADAIDPILTSGTPDTIRVRQLYDTLTKITENGEVVPWLAEELTQDTPTRWTIKLREDVKFHNGQQLTADDVVHSLKRLLSPESHNASVVHMLTTGGIRKTGEFTVELNLSTPAYYLPESLQFPAASIVPKDFDPKNPVGTGPFTLKSFTPGQQVHFVRFDDYFESPAKLDEIVVSTFSDESARVTALQGGQLDHAPLLAATFAQVVKATQSLQINQYPSGRFENFVLHCESPEFRDPRVRQAMRLLMNRQQIVDQAYGGLARVGNDIPEPTSQYRNTALPQWEHDADRAKALLAEAGATNLDLELVTAPLTPTTVSAAEVYVQQLTEAGVKAKIKQVDAGAFYGPGFGERPFTQDIWGGWTFATFTVMTQLPTSSFNETSWKNDDFLKAFESASATVDEAERREHLNKAQELMHAESGTLIPAFLDVLDVYGANVSGFGGDVLGMGGGNFDYRAVSLA